MEDPNQLLANPFNFRIHPAYQQEALADILGEVGWVTTIIVNRTTGHVLDGHLRVSEAIKHGEAEIPVTYVELTEQEELEILATFDPIKELAGKTKKRAQALAERVRANTDALRQLVESLKPPLDVTKREAKETITKDKEAEINAVFAFGEFRILLPQAELSQWWEAQLTQFDGNRQQAVNDILRRLGVALEADHDGQPVA